MASTLNTPKLRIKRFTPFIHTMPGEEWRDLPIEVGYTTYIVSSLGRVCNKTTGRIFEPKPCNDGYIYVCLSHDTLKSRFEPVHRLVAWSFIPNPENKPTVDHIDHQRGNNVVTNLRWANPQEQRQNRGDSVPRKKIIYQLSLTGELVRLWDSSTQVAEEMGLEEGMVEIACDNKVVLHDHLWRYHCRVTSFTGEIWLPINIDDLIGEVEASNYGRIRRNKAIMSGSKTDKGYRLVGITTRNNARKHLLIHRVVCTAFYGTPSIDRNVVNHKNGIKYDNRSCNLEWTSQKENMQHAHTTGLVGSKRQDKRPVWQITKEGTIIKEYGSIHEASDASRIPVGSISGVCNGINITGGGFVWRYVGDTRPIDLTPRWTVKEEGSVKDMTPSKAGRAVKQFTEKGEFITLYPSMAIAGLHTKVDSARIGDVCRGRGRNLAGGFIWRYADDESPLVIPNNGTHRQVLCFRLDGAFIAMYPSIVLASMTTGATTSQIIHGCRDHNRKTGMYIWRYAEEKK
jgi:hypothetical protein